MVPAGVDPADDSHGLDWPQVCATLEGLLRSSEQLPGRRGPGSEPSGVCAPPMSPDTRRTQLRAFASARDWQQFHSPKSIVSLIVEMLEPFRSRVYESCCGSGGFLCRASSSSRTTMAAWARFASTDSRDAAPK